MKALTLHPTQSTPGGAIGQGSSAAEQSMDSNNKRTNSSNYGGQDGTLSSHGGGTSAIQGISNIDSSVHHYELPNLA